MSEKSKTIVALIMIPSLTQLGLGLAMCIMCFFIKRFDRLPTFIVPLSVQMGAAVSADIMITGPLIYFLNKNRTGFRRTNSLINRLIIWSVNTALITGVFELLQLITWVTMTNTLMFLGFHLVIAKLYTNSMLAMLNGRKSLRDQFDGQVIEASTLIIASQTSDVQTTDIMLNSNISLSHEIKRSLPRVDTAILTQRHVIDHSLLAAVDSPTVATTTGTFVSSDADSPSTISVSHHTQLPEGSPVGLAV